jgi:hypothetical protein
MPWFSVWRLNGLTVVIEGLRSSGAQFPWAVYRLDSVNVMTGCQAECTLLPSSQLELCKMPTKVPLNSTLRHFL